MPQDKQLALVPPTNLEYANLATLLLQASADLTELKDVDVTLPADSAAKKAAAEAAARKAKEAHKKADEAWLHQVREGLRMDYSPPVQAVEATPKEIEKLRALGYASDD